MNAKINLPTNSSLIKACLLHHGFRYNKAFSTTDLDIYTYRFPVYKYKKFIVLECELNIFMEDGKVSINIYNYGTNDKYAPFYHLEYGNYDKMLKIINEKIDKELKQLSIIQTSEE
ncbi:MAG: hypothetical protein K2N80_01950 [Lachnospiraceae bacterium]|nr:hypothetical protein [Lachnospiraceae bacterium]